MFLPSVRKTYLMYAYQTNCQTLSVSHRFYQNIVIPFRKRSLTKYYNMGAYNFNKRGICIYSKPHISVTVLDYTYAFQEYIWCSVSPSNFLLCCVYRSPSSADANDLHLCSMLEDVLHTNYRDIIVIGDFNF